MPTSPCNHPDKGDFSVEIVSTGVARVVLTGVHSSSHAQFVVADPVSGCAANASFDLKHDTSDTQSGTVVSSTFTYTVGTQHPTATVRFWRNGGPVAAKIWQEQGTQYREWCP